MCDDDDLYLEVEVARLKELLASTEADLLNLCLCLSSVGDDNIAVRARVILRRWKPRVDAWLKEG